MSALSLLYFNVGSPNLCSLSWYGNFLHVETSLLARKDRTLDGGGVMLLIHKHVSHMPITELENGSESVW